MTGGMMFDRKWKYVRDSDNGIFIPHSHVSGPKVSVHCAGGNLDDVEPDMMLIAAAPELLDDGQWLLNRLVEFERELKDDAVAREFYGHVSPAIARFRMAIAKALGEQK